MSAPTIIRIKRRLEDEPSPVLVVAGKRQKLEADPEVFSHTFSLAGTVTEKGNIEKFLSKEELQKNFKKLNSITLNETLQKRLADRAKATQEKRFQVFEERRDYSSVSLIDIQEEIEEAPGLTLNGVQMVRDHVKPKETFVYDLYYASGVIDYIDGPITVQYYHDVEVDDTVDTVDVDQNSDDENREDYYTNDYPSTPEDSDVDLYGDSFNEQFNRFVIDDEEGSEVELESWENKMRKLMDEGGRKNIDSDDDDF